MLTGADVLHRYPTPDLPFQLVNNYGPTECTVVTTSGTVPSRPAPQLPPSIGRPISNVQIYVLDDDLRRVVAPGISGELFVGGAGVARGYRGRPDLTAERFIPNPLKSGTEERLYRTGDLACLLPDGQVAFLGRTDEQIKVSGYRIEPNEIAHALARCEGVQTAFVTSREDTLGNKNLVGYVVARPEATLQSSQLRAALQQQLPAYMIPSDFVLLEHLPLRANGKIDRGVLPVPTPANLLTDAAFVAPRNAIEERLTGIVSGLLNLSHVSVEDNFFMLGGHSLLGTQLIGRVRDAFRVELSLRAVFDASTIAQLSLEIEKLLVAQVEALSEAEAQVLLQTQKYEQLANEKNALQP
jgi:acyl carrier protein